MEEISKDEKIRLFNGDGSWKSYSAGGKFPSFVMSDGPHGLRKQDQEHYADINESKVATCYPTASCSAAGWDRNAVSRMAECLAREALKEEVDVVLGCGINIKRSPLCGRNFEYFSEDPYLTGELGASYIYGIQKEGPGTSLKHYCCNSQETRRQTSNSIVDQRTLSEIYLRAFEKVVRQAQPYTIMSSYNRVNGKYVGCDEFLLKKVLREKWGFKGIVISDWGACIGAAESVNAGMDLAMPDSSGYITGCLSRSHEKGEVEESALERANKGVLELAEKLAAKRRKVEVDYKVHHEVSRSLAEGSAVLLKNDGILPLKEKDICVVGELAEFMQFQGGGSSHITTAKYPNAIEALEAVGYSVDYTKGYYAGFCKQSKVASKNAPLAKEALAVVEKNKDKPVLFFCGLTESYEGEGFDRTTLALPKEQVELLSKILEITSNVVLVSFSGAPVVFPCRDKVRAILHMYLCGEGAGEAVADLVSGKVNPSGKLAETFPLRTEDTPCYGNFALPGDNVEYREQVLVGYRYYDTMQIPVEYEFGYGLSYTCFEYSDFKVDGNNVIITVTNVGDRDGAETVEVYVVNPDFNGDRSKGIVRARKELRGFDKVFLKAGESKTLEIALDDNAFKVYSEKTGGFETVGGTYEVQACSSLSNVRASGTVKVEGKTLEEVASPVSEDFYMEHAVKAHKKGEYTVSDSLIDMSKDSAFVRRLLRLMVRAMIMTSKSKSAEDPAVKIGICGASENPLESLISTSGGLVKEKFVRFIVRKANR